jgi:hypothetical protein
MCGIKKVCEAKICVGLVTSEPTPIGPIGKLAKIPCIVLVPLITSIPEAIPEINKRVVLYNVEEVVYNLYKPTLIDTTHEHCVINNSDESRIILSLTIWDTTYDEALFFLKNLNV